MIEDNGKYYVYRHIRLDSEIPFYVGIGTKAKGNTHKRVYNRSYAKRDRTNHWKNIVNNIGYRIEILLETNDYQFALQKEIEFIGLYGRRDRQLGSLLNLTDGGEGQTGIIRSEETRKRLSESLKGRMFSDEHKAKLKEVAKIHYIKVNLRQKHFDKFSKKVYQYDTFGDLVRVWEYPQQINKILKIKISGVFNCLLGRTKSSYGFHWSYKKLAKEEVMRMVNNIPRKKDKFLKDENYVIVTNIATGEKTTIKSRQDALRLFPKSGTSSIYKYLRGELKSCEGYTCKLVTS